MYSALIDPISLYAASVLRVGYGLLYLALLLRSFRTGTRSGVLIHRGHRLAAQLFDQTGWFSILTLSDSLLYFEDATRWLSSHVPLHARLADQGDFHRVRDRVASFHARAIFMTDGGDNLMLLVTSTSAWRRAVGAGPSMRAETGCRSHSRGAGRPTG
jgi:hypothetical protein